MELNGVLLLKILKEGLKMFYFFINQKNYQKFLKMVKNRFYSFIKKVYDMNDFKIKKEFAGKVYTNEIK